MSKWDGHQPAPVQLPWFMKTAGGNQRKTDVRDVPAKIHCKKCRPCADIGSLLCGRPPRAAQNLNPQLMPDLDSFKLKFRTPVTYRLSSRFRARSRYDTDEQTRRTDRPTDGQDSHCNLLRRSHKAVGYLHIFVFAIVLLTQAI